jgi:phosphoribosylaminoimidazolecarboxamide formyltransferase/IMP cyclohydrolase
MINVKRVLISAYKKEGLVDFAKGLSKHGIKILSTHGTAKLLRENEIEVDEISDYIQFPEILDGRVKTLHPKIHAGLLARRDNEQDMEQLKSSNIEPIDMVVINLYPFSDVIKKNDISLDEVIEFIDIGGPTMLRAAAKNYKFVVVVSSPHQYKLILDELEREGGISEVTSFELAKDVFYLTSHYDSIIANYLENLDGDKLFSEKLILKLEKISDLRYGENPHQKASLYKDSNWDDEFNLVNAKKLHGKELSFNNWLDLESAATIVSEYEEPCACVIKHSNPCGVAISSKIEEAFSKAYECDSLSAFGGIVGLNREVDGITADRILSCEFLECIIAPDYEDKALEMLRQKKNLRIMRLNPFPRNPEFNSNDIRRIKGGFLIQKWDKDGIKEKNLKVVTEKSPTEEELKTLIFTWKAVKNIKSNAIVLAKSFDNNTYATVGIGMGQTSRVDSVIIASRKAGERAKGSVLASDAFFPKPDAIEEANKAGVKAIIQPGGSIRDKNVIEKCNQLGIAMVFTGMRHFRH